MASAPGFFGYLCARRLILYVIHVLLWVTLFLTTVSTIVVTDNPATEVVIVFNYVGIVVLLAITGYFVVKCRQLSEAA